MGEYSPLIKRLGGQVIEIAPDSPHHINPMDIDLSFDEENPMALKADFILSLMELIVGGKDGLQPVERTVIDRCVRQMYREHLQDPETSKMPTLQTLYDLLCSQPEGEAVRLATALEIYVSGSLNVFNHETNVHLNRRLVCLDLKAGGRTSDDCHAHYAGLGKLAGVHEFPARYRYMVLLRRISCATP